MNELEKQKEEKLKDYSDLEVREAPALDRQECHQSVAVCNVYPLGLQQNKGDRIFHHNVAVVM